MMFHRFFRKYSAIVVLTHDISVILFSWCLAYFIRYDLNLESWAVVEHGLKALALVTTVHVFFYCIYKTYRPIWRFFSFPELLRLSKAIFFGWILNITLLFALNDLIEIPKSIWFIYPLWLILLLGLSRLMIRYLSDMQSVAAEIKRILIIGAGKETLIFLREMKHYSEKKYQPIAILDNDLTLLDKEICGVPVVAKIEALSTAISRYKIHCVVIALSTIERPVLQNIFKICEKYDVLMRILPPFTELEESQYHYCLPREVSLEDLLGRDAVELDWSQIKTHLSQQVVLVSGGGGSIGSELCQQILKLKPALLIVVDHSEFNLYQIEQLFQKINVHAFVLELLDITDITAVRHVVAKYKPALIFHAAGYKHVPMLETRIVQAVKNNVLGTKVLAQAAIENQVSKFVMVSSDKAVNPKNIMGATKRIAEILCQAYNTMKVTRFITVRFGNVIGSTGSVIPLFQQQISQGGPITVTHPEITRYFMTIREAAQLVLQAGSMGHGGEIFVLDMGKPIKIVDLAKDLIRLSGKKIEEIEIFFTGLRPGEKMYEELFYEQEALSETAQKKIFRANIFPRKSLDELQKLILQFEKGCFTHNESIIIAAFKTILADEGRFLTINTRDDAAILEETLCHV